MSDAIASVSVPLSVPAYAPPPPSRTRGVEDVEMGEILSDLTSIVPGGAVQKALRDTFNPLKKSTEDAWTWDRLLKQRVASVTKEHMQAVRIQYDSLKKIVDSVTRVLLHKMFEGYLLLDARRVLADARSTLASLERSWRLNLYTATLKLAEQVSAIHEVLLAAKTSFSFAAEDDDSTEERASSEKYVAALAGAIKGLELRQTSDYELFAKSEAETKAAAKTKRDANKAEKESKKAEKEAAAKVTVEKSTVEAPDAPSDETDTAVAEELPATKTGDVSEGDDTLTQHALLTPGKLKAAGRKRARREIGF